MVATVRNLADGGASMTTRRPARRVVGRRFLQETAAGPIVEFAVVVPVLLMLLIGIIDLAWAFNRRNSYVTGVREAARYAAVSQDPCAAIAAIKARVNSRLEPKADTVPWSSISVTSGPNRCTIPTDSTITVKIDRVPFVGITKIPFTSFIGQAVSLSASATFRWERAN